MNIYDLAREGDIEGLQIALLEGEHINMDDLALAAIEGDQLHILEFIMHNGNVDTRFLYDMAKDLDKEDIMDYLEDYIEYPPTLEDAVADDDIDMVKDFLHKKEVTINEVASMASRYNNGHILRYALKHGADNYNEMIDMAVDHDLVSYLTTMKEDEEWLNMTRI